MTGARYEALAARVTDGPDLPDGPLAAPASTPPGPYSEHAVAAVVADRDARIRELEAEVETAYALGQRDAWMAVARAVGLEVSDCLGEEAIRAELARLRGATAQ